MSKALQPAVAASLVVCAAVLMFGNPLASRASAAVPAEIAVAVVADSDSAAAPAAVFAPGVETIRAAIAAYEQAQAATERGERLAGFKRAARLFGSAIDNGAANADLYANLGTASLQAERLGEAVLAFRRALLLDPDHSRALHNLAHARSLLPVWVPRPEATGLLESFFFWQNALSHDERLALAGLFFLVLACTVGWAIRSGSVLAGNVALLPGLVWVALVVSLAVDTSPARSASAVLVAEETVARAADSGNAPTRFSQPLPGGTEVEILEGRQRWVRIKLSGGGDAWVARSSVARVSSPAT